MKKSLTFINPLRTKPYPSNVLLKKFQDDIEIENINLFHINLDDSFFRDFGFSFNLLINTLSILSKCHVPVFCAKDAKTLYEKIYDNYSTFQPFNKNTSHFLLLTLHSVYF